MEGKGSLEGGRGRGIQEGEEGEEGTGKFR